MENEHKPDMGLDLPESVAKENEPAAVAKKKLGGIKILVTAIVVVVVVVILGVLVTKYTDISLFGKNVMSGYAYNHDAYHAVFLSNGQVYFGKVNKADAEHMILEDIYYLQVSEPLQQVPPEGTAAQPQLSLVKLGNELHGPRDYMKINSRQILFVEELKADSRVVEAITSYKAGGAPKQPSAPAPTQ